jgi:NAD(P)-dependent dehydrogenase (short-subunit alcohol dehydrogenase family)
VIVVTGATGVTGRAVCAALVAAGETVVAVSSNAERLETVDAAARFHCDLTDPAATVALAATVRAEVGPVAGLVHLVGGWRTGHELDDWDWLEPRILTTLRTTTLAFHDDLTASAAGRLVVIGSASAAKPTWSGANYATLKTAADAWVAAVASGWRKAGTAAAVTLVVSSIGDNGTAPETIAQVIIPLWSQPAADLNGTHIAL